VRMRFGTHKGCPVHTCPRDYLAWLLGSELPLSTRLRDEVETVLVPDMGCLGPRWWHLQRAGPPRCSDRSSEKVGG
jgi:hypothetical protein